MLFHYLIALLALTSFLPFIPLESSPYTGTASIFIPYANARSNYDLARSPTIHVGFNGSSRYHAFAMDTGSLGIIASADYFQPAPDAQNLGPGEQHYSSSGIIEKGTWWSATQQFYDSDGQRPRPASHCGRMHR